MTAAETPVAPVAVVRSLWRHPDFLKLWSAETISQFGSQVTGLALPLVAILTLQASAFEVGLLTAIEFLPFLIVGLPAGVWVDRLRRRPILIAGDLGRAAALGSIPLAYVLGVLSIAQLYVVAFVVGVLTVFFDVAYQSYLPSLVDRSQLVEGNSKLEVSRSGAGVLGPGIAGALIELFRAPLAIALDALSFVLSGLFVLLIRRQEPVPVRAMTADGSRAGMRAQIAEGLRYVLGHPLLRHIAATTATSNLFSIMAQAVLLVYAVRELGLEPGTIGLIFSLGALGFLGGAVLTAPITRRVGLGRAIVGSIFFSGFALLLVPLAPRDNPVPLLVAAQAIVGFGVPIYNINQVSLRQAITPERMQGRMNATMRFVVWGVFPIGALIGGVLGTTIGLQPTLWVSAIGATFAFLPVFFSQVRSLRAIPEAATAEGT